MEQDLEQALGWIRLLCPPQTPGMVWIGSKSTNFRGEKFRPDDTGSILHEIGKRHKDPGVFMRMGTIRPDALKRGKNSDTVTLFGLWADLDYGTDGHKHEAGPNKLPLPPDADTARELVRHLPEPSAWVNSGGGLYAYWLPQRPWDASTEQAQQTLAQLGMDLQETIRQRATELGYHYGTGVGDLARILRIPGTINRKVPQRLKRCDIEWGGGPRYSLDQMRRAVPMGRRAASVASPSASGAPLVPVAARQIPKARRIGRLASPALSEAEAADSPLDEFARRNDIGQLLRQAGWTLAYEREGRAHWTRPGKSTSEGVSANVYEDQGRQVLYVFTDATEFPPNRGLSCAEVYAWLNCGGDLSAAATALRRAGYGTQRTVSSTPSAASPAAQKPVVGISVGGGTLELASNAAAALWDERPILQAIRRTARARRVGPWAVLGGVLALAACRIGPHVVLPPIVGGPASLNLFVGLVGPSGAGKGAATAVAAELLGPDAAQTPVKKLGTGQGIDAAYTAQTKEGPVQYNDTALFTIGEIDSLAAHASMNGSTLLATLREVYSGEALGAHYADRYKRRPVKAHHYRAGIIAGIQPAKAGVLLDDADGGTPQRWLWFPTNDPDRKRGPARRLAAASRDSWWEDYQVWMPAGEQAEDEPVPLRDRIEVPVCASAWQAIWADRDARLDMGLDEQAQDLRGHALLTRLKVAAILGFLDGRCEVTEDDWSLAARIQLVSEQTRALCQNAVTQRAVQESVRRGRARARSDDAAADEAASLETRKVQQVAERAMKKLQLSGDWTTRRVLAMAAGRDLRYLDRAMELLESDGLVARRENNPGTPRASVQYRSVTT